MSEQKTPPAMFEGARVPKDPAPTATAKPADRAAALKSASGGVPAGRLTGFALLPVIAVGLIALAAWSPMAALIAGGALLVMVLIGMVSRSAGKRRVATRTSVRPDGTVTTTTKPVSRRERNRRQRTRSGPLGRRPRGDGGSPNPRSRSWIPGSDRRSRRSAAHNGPGSGSPGGRKTPGSRPDGGNPSRPSARQRMRDRMWPNRKDRNTAGSSAGPGGRTAPSGPGKPHPPGSPNSRSRDNSKRWPWSRNRNSDGSPGGRTPGGSPNGRRPKNNAGSPGSPGGGNWRPWRGKSNGGGGPSGQPGGKKPRNVKHTASSAPSGGKPSKVPNWVKRVVAPASPPPQREWTGGAGSRAKDKVRGKVRDKWRSAWADNTPLSKPSPSGRNTAAPKANPESRRRNWWPTRHSAGPSASTGAPAATAGTEGRYRRLWRKLNRPAKVPTRDFAAELDEHFKARGIGRRGAPKPDPVVQPKPSASSAASAAFAEDWAPAPPRHTADRHSAESGLLGEDWVPQPYRPAPRSVSKGESKMSDQGGIPHVQPASSTVKLAATHERAANGAARLSAAHSAVANATRSQAAAVSQHEGMEAHAAELQHRASEHEQDSATTGAFAGKLRQWGANAANLIRR